MAKSTGSGVPIPGVEFTAFAALNQRTLNAMAHMNVDMARRMLDMNTQYLEFIRHRLDEDEATGNRLGDCKTMPEVVETVTSFYRTAFQEYAGEMQKLMQLGSSAAAETLAEAESEVKHALEGEDAKV